MGTVPKRKLSHLNHAVVHFEGRDYADKAQNFVVDKEDAVADDLIVWYKEVTPDGKSYKEGLADFLKLKSAMVKRQSLKLSSSKLTGLVHQRNTTSHQRQLDVQRQLLELLDLQRHLLEHQQ